ncbi:Serine protease [Tsukamurella ocularis]
MESVKCAPADPVSMGKIVCDTPSLSGTKQGSVVLTEGTALRFVNGGGREIGKSVPVRGTDRICALSFFMRDDNGNVYAASGSHCAPDELMDWVSDASDATPTSSGVQPIRGSDTVTTTDGIPVGKIVAFLRTTNAKVLNMYSIPVIKLSPELAKSAHATVTRIGPVRAYTEGEYLGPSSKGKYVKVEVQSPVSKETPDGEGAYTVRPPAGYGIGAPGDIGAPLLQNGALTAVVTDEFGVDSIFDIRKSLGQVPDAPGLKISSLK